jgi:hypothetical protein
VDEGFGRNWSDWRELGVGFWGGLGLGFGEIMPEKK